LRSPRPVPILRRRPGVRHHRRGTAAVPYVSRLEQDNRFCIACHRPGSRRLHGELFDRYAATPPVNLSAAHPVARKTVKCMRMILPLRDRECIQCHAAHVAGDPRLQFVNNQAVLPRCQRCHKEMGQAQQ